MSVRMPAVAGRFYPESPARCRDELLACLPDQPCAAMTDARPLGGLMPHAGWMCSGAIAGRAAAALTLHCLPRTVVIFGAVHFWPGTRAAVYPKGKWITPLGPVQIDADLAERVLDADTQMFEANVRAHDGEHSIEVEVPFFQHLAPDARLLPIMVPPTPRSADVGRAVAGACRDADVDVLFVASSDLTHYGPSYGFTPHGIGEQGLSWATTVNDRRMIDRMLALRDDEIVPEAAAHQNACGSGAIAATIAACRAFGVSRAILLEHANSHEILKARFDEPPTDAVGYAAIAFVAP